MDASQILVAVLTAFAVGWLVWAELRSRRNVAAEKNRSTSPTEAGDSKAPAVPETTTTPTKKGGRRYAA
jgi:hypothetical protein